LTTPCTDRRLQESVLLSRLADRLSGPPGQTWVGDDAAVVPAPAGAMVLAADAVVAGVHCDLSLVGLDDMGWKALAVNVSDLAAMGARPTHALVTLIGTFTETDFEDLYRGLAAASTAYGCPVVGGDLSAGGGLALVVAVVGDGAGPAFPVLRSGAQPGDTVMVTGPLGSSAAGLALLQQGRGGEAPDLVRAHRRPTARVAEGRVARAHGATAMIDVSDGLGIDLHRLANASGVGIKLDRVPVAQGVELVIPQGPSGPLSGIAGPAGEHSAAECFALGGGEDYELIFTVADPAPLVAGFIAAGLSEPLAIGRCTAQPGERRWGHGAMPLAGWEYSW